MREAGKLFFEDCGNSCRLSGNEKTNSQYVTSNRSRSSDLFQVSNNVNLSTFSVKYVRDKLLRYSLINVSGRFTTRAT